MSQARLAVLMPNYNHARFLPRALDSVLSQSKLPDRIVVIDDASTDDSLAVLEDYAARHPILTVVRNPVNLGVVPNLNRLIELAGCSHGFFMAADDCILPGLFERSMRLLETYPQAGLCSGLSLILDPEGRDLGLLATPLALDQEGYLPPATAAAFMAAEGPWIMNNTCIYRMDALAGAGGFDPDLASFSDGLISDVVALRHGACFIPDFLAYWRHNPHGFSAQTSRDLARVTAIMRHSLMLMRTRYADVYTPRLRDLFRRFFCKRHNPGIDIQGDEAP